MKKPIIVSKKAFKTAGYSVNTDMSKANQDCPQVWDKFNKEWEDLPNVINKVEGFGICTKYDESNNFSYMAAMEVSSYEGLKDKFDTFDIPESDYLVFEHDAPMSELGKTYESAMKYIEESNEYEHNPTGNQFELYNEDFNPQQSKFKFYLYFPINKK